MVRSISSAAFPTPRIAASAMISDERYDTAVVVGVHLAVEQEDARDLHRFNDCVNFGLIAAFGKVWDTFDQCGHGERINKHSAVSNEHSVDNFTVEHHQSLNNES
jgi:hypothetical protein